MVVGIDVVVVGGDVVVVGVDVVVGGGIDVGRGRGGRGRGGRRQQRIDALIK